MTAYADESANYVGELCDECYEAYRAYWQERWDEYYSDIRAGLGDH